MFYILKTIIIELLYLGMERTRHSIFQLAKFRMSMKSARLHSRQGFSVILCVVFEMFVSFYAG